MSFPSFSSCRTDLSQLETNQASLPDPSDGALEHVRDLRVLSDKYEEMLAVKDEAIRRLTTLLTQINAATPRRGTQMSSQMVVEKQFRKVPPHKHALPSIFGPNDWEEKLDGITQLTLTLLVQLSGLSISRLETLDFNRECVEYRASCTATGINRQGVGWRFPFELLFKLEDVPREESSTEATLAPTRIVYYTPRSTQDHPLDAVKSIRSFSLPSSFPFSELSVFYADMRAALIRTHGTSDICSNRRPGGTLRDDKI
ncbi:hypothetical protein VNI00_005329 [Paramarasmius palmivorus]|uniref:Uncharacterized protein n=1 Tax=Paramarasmius palmivorus TaxID=297713 RepID=A0AAW0DDQ9_9AGAR